MGCDIHLHTEVKINGEWHHYSAPSIGRNYSLFAKMAGVRGDETPIAEPRGLPEDATALTKFDRAKWGTDGHSTSWLNAKEILQLCEWAKAERVGAYGKPAYYDWECGEVGYLFGNSWSGFEKYPSDRPEGLEDIRWIFWFDN